MVYRRAPESRMALVQLAQETCAQAIFFNHLYDPISLVRDNEVKAAMSGLGLVCQSFNADLLYEPWEVLSDARQPLTSFVDFWRRCEVRAVACLSHTVEARLSPHHRER
jgi:cryptochrome 1